MSSSSSESIQNLKKSIQVLAKCINHIINAQKITTDIDILIELHALIPNEEEDIIANEVFEVDDSATQISPVETISHTSESIEVNLEHESIKPAPVKIKRKTKAALEKEARLAAEAKAKADAEVVVSESTTIVTEPVAEKPVAVSSVTSDPYRTHPSRLQKIDETLCIARRIDDKNPLPGTRRNDEGSNNGMIFPEKQCTRKPVPGSKLCADCAKKDAKFKENPNHKDESWRGRLDETVIYARAKIVGCKFFFEKYPNGIRGDPFKAVIEKPVAVVADNLPLKSEWENFKYEGYEHIRNLKTGYCFRRDILKPSTEDNANEEQYAGKWVNGKLDATIPYDA